MNLYPIPQDSAQRVCAAIETAFPFAQKVDEQVDGFYAVVSPFGQLAIETDLDLAGEDYRAALIEAVVLLIKAEAERRILAQWPDWRQRNALMDGGSALTECRAYVNGVREASNEAEAGVSELSIEELCAFDVSGW